MLGCSRHESWRPRFIETILAIRLEREAVEQHHRRRRDLGDEGFRCLVIKDTVKSSNPGHTSSPAKLDRFAHASPLRQALGPPQVL